MRPQRSRDGFGILELMIVLALIAFLLALALPLVQRLREEAVRTQSMNNLKQLGLSFHAFHDTFKRMPFNGSDAAVKEAKYSKVAKDDNYQSGSWAFQVLPFVEQTQAFRKVSREVGMPVFLCPGRGRPILEMGGGAWSDYFYNNYLNDAAKADKADNPDNRTQLFRIVDGTSNTVMLGHGNISRQQYKDAKGVTLSSNIFDGGTFGTARAGKGGVANPEGVTLAPDSEKAPGIGSWGGPFSRGGLFAFCDGHVQFIHYGYTSLNALLTPAGAEAVFIP